MDPKYLHIARSGTHNNFIPLKKPGERTLQAAGPLNLVNYCIWYQSCHLLTINKSFKILPWPNGGCLHNQLHMFITCMNVANIKSHSHQSIVYNGTESQRVAIPSFVLFLYKVLIIRLFV